MLMNRIGDGWKDIVAHGAVMHGGMKMPIRGGAMKIVLMLKGVNFLGELRKEKERDEKRGEIFMQPLIHWKQRYSI